MKGWLGIDCGSISLKFALIDADLEVVSTLYMRNQGIIPTLQRGLREFWGMIPHQVEILGCGVTGSARRLLSVLVNADMVRTEILAHAIGAMKYVPDVNTIFEIGGEDSKLITLEDRIITDFAMNNICSGGTGAFLDALAARLGIRIEDFGDIALRGQGKVNIAGRCTVFATTDAIHKLNSGYALEDVLMGVCNGLVRNYLSMLARGKRTGPPYCFQGGTSRNKALKRALEEQINHEVIVPPYAECLGAVGMAILAKHNGQETRFKGFDLADLDYKTRSFTCHGCDNRCEIVQVLLGGKEIAGWGSRCGKWNFDYSPEASEPVGGTPSS